MPQPENTRNNGGKTDYYSLPAPSVGELIDVLSGWNGKSWALLAEQIIAMFPNTLNDLIEAQDMEPWQHEVMKACWAFKARSAKPGASPEREVNKIIYYANRKRDRILKNEGVLK